MHSSHMVLRLSEFHTFTYNEFSATVVLHEHHCVLNYHPPRFGDLYSVLLPDKVTGVCEEGLALVLPLK